MRVWKNKGRVGVPVGCAGNGWKGHIQSKQRLLPMMYIKSFLQVTASSWAARLAHQAWL